jgi:hypothetical protein
MELETVPTRTGSYGDLNQPTPTRKHFGFSFSGSGNSTPQMQTLCFTCIYTMETTKSPPEDFGRRPNLPNVDFYKTSMKPLGTGHRKNHLPHGVCRVSVRRAADMWQRTMA